MKKTAVGPTRKLHLHRETLRQLSSAQLLHVLGAGPPDPKPQETAMSLDQEVVCTNTYEATVVVGECLPVLDEM